MAWHAGAHRLHAASDMRDAFACEGTHVEKARVWLHHLISDAPMRIVPAPSSAAPLMCVCVCVPCHTTQVFTLEELQLIARLCQQHDVIAMCDEVYEHLVFNGSKHISLRALPGMADRCVRLGSAGKTFSFTAWKVS